MNILLINIDVDFYKSETNFRKKDIYEHGPAHGNDKFS